jgi:3-hydroxyisobutyrate dehydrogenase-like beta-hydroxyacid dehydrogenase
MAAPLDDAREGAAGTRVALVGLGNMGQAVAERLLDAGYPLAVYNRTPERAEPLVARGARRLETAAGALRGNAVCLLSLADDDAVEAVTLGEGGVLDEPHRDSVLVDTSTISVAASEALASRAAERGVRYLRAPFSGNPTAVRAGNAVLFVSGPRDTADEVEPLLRAIAPTVRYVGDGELARVLKLVLQVMIGGTVALLAEGIVLGEAAGLERRTLLEAIRSSVVGSTFVEYKSEPLLRDDYTATFTTAMMGKDVELVLDLARTADVELPLTHELHDLLEAACEHGHADQDFSSLVLELQARAGHGARAGHHRNR